MKSYPYDKVRTFAFQLLRTQNEKNTSDTTGEVNVKLPRRRPSKLEILTAARESVASLLKRMADLKSTFEKETEKNERLLARLEMLQHVKAMKM